MKLPHRERIRTTNEWELLLMKIFTTIKKVYVPPSQLCIILSEL